MVWWELTVIRGNHRKVLVLLVFDYKSRLSFSVLPKYLHADAILLKVDRKSDLSKSGDVAPLQPHCRSNNQICETTLFVEPQTNWHFLTSNEWLECCARVWEAFVLQTDRFAQVRDFVLRRVYKILYKHFLVCVGALHLAPASQLVLLRFCVPRKIPAPAKILEVEFDWLLDQGMAKATLF